MSPISRQNIGPYFIPSQRYRRTTPVDDLGAFAIATQSLARSTPGSLDSIKWTTSLAYLAQKLVITDKLSPSELSHLLTQPFKPPEYNDWFSIQRRSITPRDVFASTFTDKKTGKAEIAFAKASELLIAALVAAGNTPKRAYDVVASMRETANIN